MCVRSVCVVSVCVLRGGVGVGVGVGVCVGEGGCEWVLIGCRL